MNENVHHSELIEKYFEEGLNREELCEFENLMKVNPDFRLEFQLEQKLRHLEIKEDVLAFRAKLQSIVAGNIQPAAIKPENTGSSGEHGSLNLFRRIGLKYRIAAAVILFIALSSVLYLISRSGRSGEQLFAQYFQPYPAGQTVRSDLSDDLISAAFARYEKQEYLQAAGLFEKALADSPGEEMLTFYLAMSFTGAAEFDKAAGLFERLTGQTEGNFIEQSKWYLALVYLRKENRKDQCIVLLGEIAGSDGFKAEEAGKLLRAYR